MTSSLAGRPVARVGFGAMQIPGPGVKGPPRDREAALAVLRRAVELGVNHIDTAQYYGPDVANELIHTALFPYPDDLVLVSKVGARRDDAGAWLPAQTPAELRSGVEDNLRSLEIERVDVVNLRLIGADEGGSAEPFAGQLAEMVALREEGKIGGVGLSNITEERLREALATTEIACVQNPFSLVDRTHAGLLALCLEHDIPFVPFFPLGSAFPAMPKVVDRPGVREQADRLGVTPAQLGLAWLLDHAPNILLIPGTSSVAHLEENVAAGEVRLDDVAREALSG